MSWSALSVQGSTRSLTGSRNEAGSTSSRTTTGSRVLHASWRARTTAAGTDTAAPAMGLPRAPAHAVGMNWPGPTMTPRPSSGGARSAAMTGEPTGGVPWSFRPAEPSLGEAEVVPALATGGDTGPPVGPGGDAGPPQTV